MDTTKIKGRVPPFTGFFWHPSFNLIFQYITIHAWKTNQFVCPFWNISGRSWCSDGSCEPSGISSFEGGKQKSAERKQSNPEMQRAIEQMSMLIARAAFFTSSAACATSTVCSLCNEHRGVISTAMPTFGLCTDCESVQRRSSNSWIQNLFSDICEVVARLPVIAGIFLAL